MNKTININLASTFFHIDENAYDLLKSYLNKLEKAFTKSQGKEEILRDVEVRIAELFQERKKNSDYVITVEDVEEVIKILGQPQDFITEEEAENETQTQTVSKKLFRDPDDKYIGGVASGMGYYFGIDTTWIRLLWLLFGLFSAGTIILIYIVLWILIPEAKTTADKLSMKGEPVNIATIEKKIREEFEEISSKIKDIDYEEVKTSLKKKSTTFFNFLENVLRLIPKLILKIFGVVFLIVSTLGIFGLIAGLVVFILFGTLEWPFNFYFNFFEFNPYPSLALITAAFLLIFIPFLFLFSLGMRLLNRKGTTLGTVSRFILLGLWFVALISLLFFGVFQLRSHRVSAIKTEKHELNISETDTLAVLLRDTSRADEKTLWEFDRSEIFADEKGEHWWVGKNFKMNILKSNTPTSFLEIKYEADGPKMKKAQKNTEEILYAYQQEGNQLSLDPMWKVQTSTRFQNQSVQLQLYLKEGQVVDLDENLKEILSYPVKNDQNFRSSHTAGKLWKMGDDVLECLNCEADKSSLRIQYKSKKGEDKLRLNVDSKGVTLKTQ